jgi:hypothetical protein
MKMNEKIARTTLFLATFLLAAQSFKKKKNNLFQTFDKLIKNSILTIPSDFIFTSTKFLMDGKQVAIYVKF